MKKVIFVDLDGTLVTTESGRPFPLHSKDWKFINETLFAVKYYLKKGYKLVIITNQGGIESGFVTEKVVRGKLETICKEIEKGFKLEENSVSYRYCTGMDGYDRKPNPGMAFDVLSDEELTLDKSIMLGNMPSDKMFATNAGVTTYCDIEQILTIDWQYKISQLDASSL